MYLLFLFRIYVDGDVFESSYYYHYRLRLLYYSFSVKRWIRLVVTDGLLPLSMHWLYWFYSLSNSAHSLTLLNLILFLLVTAAIPTMIGGVMPIVLLRCLLCILAS